MIFAIKSGKVMDLDVFLEVPLHSIFIRFLNLNLSNWVNNNLEISYGMYISDTDYITYQLNNLIQEYKNRWGIEKLIEFQEELRSITNELFLGYPPEMISFKGFSEQEIQYSISYNKRRFIEDFEVKYITGFCMIAIARLSDSQVAIRKCDNCGDYFVPTTRSDEIYCDRKIKGEKTCKDIGYEQKLLNDPITKAYRTAYKTKNAFKLRNSKNNPGIEARFEKWALEAKERMKEVKQGEISFEDFSVWLKKEL